MKDDPFYQWMERTCASLDEYGPDRSRAEIRELGQAVATGMSHRGAETGLEPNVADMKPTHAFSEK